MRAGTRRRGRSLQAGTRPRASPPAREYNSAVPGIPLGEYQLIRRLGQGATAEVYLARRVRAHGFEKQLVVKRLLPHLAADPRVTELFLLEARRAAMIDHPNLAHVSDFGELGGTYYLAMEYIEGQSLSELCAPLGRLPAPLAVRVAIEVAAALGAIHGAPEPGLVHRDLSPRNVMVRPDGVVKLLDLGNAVSGLLSRTTAAGTPGFMSPEQARGAALDQRSDLYALGALLWWMLTGQQSPAPVLSLPPRPPAELEPGLWPLLERLLAPTPEGRPSSAAEVEQELEALATSFGGAAQRSRLSELARSLRPRSARGQVVERLTQLIRGTETAPPLRRVGPWALGLLALLALLAGGVAWMRPTPAPQPAPPAPLSAVPVALPGGPILGPPTPSALPAEEVAAEPSTPEPRPSARAQSRRSPGFLTIDTDPWTEVYLGPTRLGITPLSGLRLPSGAHELELRNPGAGIRRRLKVLIRPGLTTRVHPSL